jgi:hypothetical protein
MLNIDPLIFFVSFSVGILLVYLITPEPTLVIKFPSPYNAGQVMYKDKTDSCYKYKSEKVSCHGNGKIKILPQPIQEDFILNKQNREKISKL